MPSIRRSSAVLLTTLLAALLGSAPAFAKPAPLIEPAPGSITVDTTSSSPGFLDGWLEPALVVLVVAAVVAALVLGLARLRQQSPSTV